MMSTCRGIASLRPVACSANDDPRVQALDGSFQGRVVAKLQTSTTDQVLLVHSREWAPELRVHLIGKEREPLWWDSQLGLRQVKLTPGVRRDARVIFVRSSSAACSASAATR